MGASYKLSSSNLFLRSAGKNRVSIVKLIKDHVESGVVGKEDWEVIETIGIKMSYDSLEIFDHKIKGEELKRLALNLCESRLWVNREGDCFILGLEITGKSLRFVFSKTSDLFDWSEYGVMKSDKTLESLRDELKSKGDELKKKEEELERLKMEFNWCLQEKRKEVESKETKIEELETVLEKVLNEMNYKDIEIKRSKEDLNHQILENSQKKLNNAKDTEIARLQKQVDDNRMEISKLKEELNKFVREREEDFDRRSAEISKLQRDLERLLKMQNLLIANLQELGQAAQNHPTDDKILHKWQQPVPPLSFKSEEYRQFYLADFNDKLTLRPVDEDVHNKSPNDIKVFVNNGSFYPDNWWFIKVEDEKTHEKSLFAFYGGKVGKKILSDGNMNVYVPHKERARCSANVQFIVAFLRGYGSVIGFLYI